MVNRLYDEDVLVLGLGRFGSAVALEMTRIGYHVLAIEDEQVVADHYSHRLDRVIVGDLTDPLLLDEIDLTRFRIGIVAIGDSIEASTLAASNLVRAGIPQVWGQANTVRHSRILERLGVHHVVLAERDMGIRVAHMVNGRVLDYIPVDEDFAIVKMRPPREMIGFTLAQSDVRAKYGVTIVGVKLDGESFTYATPATKISAHHTLIASGRLGSLDALTSRP